MGSHDKTTISIKGRTWERLHSRKGRGDTHDDVINRALDALEAQEQTDENPGEPTPVEGP